MKVVVEKQDLVQQINRLQGVLTEKNLAAIAAGELPNVAWSHGPGRGVEVDLHEL